MKRKSGGVKLAKLLRKAHTERPAQPYVPRQCKCSLGLMDYFLRQNVGKRLHQQGFWLAIRKFALFREPRNKFHQVMIEKRNAHFQRIRHAGRIRISQEAC